MVNEIETNVCKKKKEKKGSVSSRVVVRIYVNAIIFSTIANEHWENIGSIILSIDLSIPCFLFFFFFTNAYVKIQRMTSLLFVQSSTHLSFSYTPLNAMHSSILSLVTLFLLFSRCVSCFLIARLIAITLFRRDIRIYYLEQRGNTNKIHTRRIK